MADLITGMPTGTVGVGSAMPTSTVPAARAKPPKPTTVNPDTLERQQKGKNPKPTKPITVPALNPSEQARVEQLEETIYSARSAERSGARNVVGGTAASTWRDKRLRLATSLGLEGTTTPEMGKLERWRAGQIKGNSWRNSIETMDMLKGKWTKTLLGRGAIGALSTVGTMVSAQGKLNPLAPITDPMMDLYHGRKGRAIKGGISSALMQLAMFQFSSLTLEQERDTISSILKQNGVPDEYLEEATTAYIDGAKLPQYISSQVAGTVNDAQIIGASMAGGALIGSALPGVGTIAGLGLGWTAGTIIAGANNVLALFTANQAPNLYTAIPYNAYEDDKFITNGWTESSANKAVADFLAKQDSNRFIAYDEAAPWIQKYYSASTPLAGDPRNKEIFDLIKQGYFVTKGYDGTYGIDPWAWQSYMIESALYKNPEDKKRYLPELTAAGKEFASAPTLTETQEGWNSLWRNPVSLEYTP